MADWWADDLEKKLRMRAVTEFGGKKGSLTEALEAAIEAWVEKPRKGDKHD